MFGFSLLFPVPHLSFEHLLRIILPNESCLADFELLPVGVEIFHFNLCSECLDESFVLSDFEKFEVGIAFVPPIEPTVGVH